MKIGQTAPGFHFQRLGVENTESPTEFQAQKVNVLGVQLRRRDSGVSEGFKQESPF